MSDTYDPGVDPARRKRERSKQEEGGHNKPRHSDSSHRDRRHEHKHGHDDRSHSKHRSSKPSTSAADWNTIGKLLGDLKEEYYVTYKKQVQKEVTKFAETHQIKQRGIDMYHDENLRRIARQQLLNLLRAGGSATYNSTVSRGKFKSNMKNQGLHYKAKDEFDDWVRQSVRAAYEGDKDRRRGSRSDDDRSDDD